MYQMIIPLVVRFILSTVVENLPMDEWKEKTRTWVKDTVPGEWMDGIAWRIIDKTWDLIVGEVKRQRPMGLVSGSPMDETWSAVAHISAAVLPAVEAEAKEA